MLRRLVAAAVLAVVLSPGTAFAASLARGDRIEVRRAATPLDLDPSLADPRWSQGALTGPLFDLGTKSLAGVATAASFWYDDRALYVGVRAEQKTPVVATQATDDVVYGTDDFVGVLLDVSGNFARTYMFAVTPIAYRPDDAPAYELLGIDHLYRGHAESASRMLQRATQLDPLSPMNLIWYGKALYYARRFAEAHAALAQLSDLDAIDFGAVEVIAMNDLELGRSGEARAALAKLKVGGPKRAYKSMLSALVDVRAGIKPRALPNLRPRAPHNDDKHVDPATASALCLALGRRTDALAWVELALRDKHERATRGVFALDPRLTPLRDDARFRELTG